MGSEYVINMENGVICFRTAQTDEQINMRPIPASIVEMIVKGEIKASDVVNAIGAKLRDDPTFDFKEYDKLLKKLNVGKGLAAGAVEKDVLPDRSDETVTLDEIKANNAKMEKAEAKRERMAKVREAIEAGDSAK